VNSLPPLAVVVVLGLAAYRVTRVATADTLTAPLRARIYDWAWIDPDDNGPAYQARRDMLEAEGRDTRDGTVPLPRRGGLRTWIYALIDCPHCVGVWVSLAAYSAWRWGGDTAYAVLAVAAVAGAQSIVVSFLSPDDEGEQ
jgi:hypothetical protein